MKRVLEVLAVVLLVGGLELSVGAVSHTLEQLGRVYSELVAGAEPGVSPGRFFLGVGMVVVGVGLLTLDLWARSYGGAVGRGRICPECGARTERLKRRARHRLVAWVLGEKVTRRTCKECGWRGLAG